MRHPSTLTAPARPGAVNEDVVVAGDGVVVVVDGAGLPADLRAGCCHSVAWFASSIASSFQALLAAGASPMREALGETIACVKESHVMTCDLDRGSPSATIAAFRVVDDWLEYLVLCDASVLLLDVDGQVTHVTDGRLQGLLAARLDNATLGTGCSAEAEVRAARRSAVEATRNQPGGFWCVHTDPAAASHARYGSVPVSRLAGAVACSDGGTRAFDLVGTHTLEQFTTRVLRGELAGVANAIRDAEDHHADRLRERGLKVHDDLTIVALPFA